MSTVAELSELVTGQLAGGTRHLTVDVGGLDFADTGSIRVFLLAARTFRQRGGDLVLLCRDEAGPSAGNHRCGRGDLHPGRPQAAAEPEP